MVCAVPNKQSTVARHFGAIRWPWLAQIIPDIHVYVSELCFGADFQSI